MVILMIVLKSTNKSWLSMVHQSNVSFFKQSVQSTSRVTKLSNEGKGLVIFSPAWILFVCWIDLKNLSSWRLGQKFWKCPILALFLWSLVKVHVIHPSRWVSLDQGPCPPSFMFRYNKENRQTECQCDTAAGHVFWNETQRCYRVYSQGQGSLRAMELPFEHF